MVANYSGVKRRFDSYGTEAEALEAANKLARQLSQRDVISASMTREQSIEYANLPQPLGSGYAGLGCADSYFGYELR